MKYTLTLLLCLCSLIALSQELPDLTKYKHDIGFNTSILVNGIINSNQGPFDFMYKRQKSSNTALRIGASIYTLVNTNFSSGSSGGYQKYDQWAFDLSFGKEKQHQLNKKWIFHYGGDLLAYYSVYKTKYYYNSVVDNESENIRYGVGVQPFLGIRFQILERLYLATEASLRISYGRNGNTWIWYDNSTGSSNSREEEFNNVNVYAQPAAGIYVFYRF